MKKFRKHVSAIVVIAMFVGLLSSGFGMVSAATTEVETGSLLTVGEEGLLRHLEIISGQIDYGKQVNRGEMAHVVRGVANLPVFEEEGSYFKDVPVNNAFFGDINALVQTGVLHGDGNGLYRPLDGVTEGEMAKVFAVILGYDAVAEFSTYSDLARRAGVFEGIEMDGVVTYAELLKMAFNTMHLGMFEALTYGDKDTYHVNDNFTALEAYYGLVPQSGLVEGVWGTELDKTNTEIEKGEIRIAGRDFIWADESVLGHVVCFYSAWNREVGKTEPEIAYLYTDENFTKVLTVNAKDVRGLSGNVFSYYEGDNEKRAKLKAGFSVVYNGMTYTTYQDADLKPAFGTVTLVDNTGDGIYDVVKVESYEYGIINSADEKNGVIYLSYPQGKFYGTKEAEEYWNIFAGSGKAGSFTALKVNAPVAVRESKNAMGQKKVTVDVLAKGTAGVVESFSGDKVTISGAEYDKNPAIVIDRAYELSETVTIYTHNGVLVMVLHSATDDNFSYAYLLDIADIGTAFTSQVSLRAMTKDGKEMILNCSDKLLLDGNKETEFDDIESKLSASAALSYHTGAEEFPVAQLIRYKLGGEGKVTEIDTATYDPAVEDIHSLQLKSENVAPEGTYPVFTQSILTLHGNAASGAFYFSVANKNNLWCIPQTDRSNPDNYGVNINQAWYYPRVAEGYNVDPDTGEATIAIFYTPVVQLGGGMNDSTDHHIVNDVWTEKNDMDEILTGFTVAGSTTKYVISTKTAEAMKTASPAIILEVGDMIRFETMNGQVANLEEIYDISTRSIVAPNKDAKSPTNVAGYKFDAGPQGFRTMTALGVALNLKDGVMKFGVGTKTTPTASMGRIDYYKVGGAQYFIYETSEGKVRKATTADLVTRSLNDASTQEVLIYSSSAQARTVYIVD